MAESTVPLLNQRASPGTVALRSSASPDPAGHWEEPSFTVASKVRVVATVCLFLFACGSNWAVLASAARKGRKSPLRVLILSLSAADLLVTLVVMPLDTVWNITVQWYAGDAACKLLNFLKLFAMYSSSLVLVVISLDRQAAILHPFSFTSAGQRNRNMLAVAWAASAVLASPQLFLFHLQKASGLDFTQCVTMGSFQQHWQETLYNMFTFLTLYVMPLSAMVVCYSRILWEISRQMKEDRGLVRSNNDHFSKARMKTLRMTIVMVVSFIVCWTPYYLLGLWYWFRPEMLREIPEYVNHTLLLFGLLHTCSDPVVYGLYTPSFREDLYACWGRLGSGLTRHRLAHRPPSLSFLNVQDYGLTADLSVHGSVGSVTSNGTAVQTGF